MNTTQRFSATKPITIKQPEIALRLEGITLTGREVTHLHEMIARAAKNKNMEVVLKAEGEGKWRFNYRAAERLDARSRFSLLGSIAKVFDVEVINDYKTDFTPLNKAQTLSHKPRYH